jgi:hypothetical protein
MLLLRNRERSMCGNSMPFREARAATGGGRMLRDENRVAAHRSLPAVIRRLRRRETLPDEVVCMVEHRRKSALNEVRALLVAETEPASE